MPTIEEVSPAVENLVENVENLGLNSGGTHHDSDEESDDEFHDAYDDRVPQLGVDEGKEEDFTEAEILELIASGEASKTKGNKLYVEEHWEEAKQCYAHGLTQVPKRKRTLPPPSPTREDDENKEVRVAQPVVDTPPPTELEKRVAAVRSQLCCNIGACCIKLNDHEGAVKACTEALLDDPKYVKAIQRRAASNEAIGTWAALSSAESDYTTLLELLPPSDQPPVRRALVRVKPRAEEAKQRETAEMMGKLKDLGNSLLGRFGLSTDNFQFTPNSQGGYGMNFVR